MTGKNMKKNNRLASRLAANRLEEQGPVPYASMRQSLDDPLMQPPKPDASSAVRTATAQQRGQGIFQSRLKENRNIQGGEMDGLFSDKASSVGTPSFKYQANSKFSEEELEIDELKKRHEENVKEKRYRTSTRIINGLLIVACIYVVFLIYGVSVTDYQYTKDGTVVAQRLSVDEIREKKGYETVKVQYESCRILYEKVLMLDYRLAQGEEDPLTLAPEYEALLDDVSNLSVKTEAMSSDSKYAQIKSMLLSWIKDDIAVYLQNMSAAISQNNSERASNALQDKDRVYANFSQITSNMVTIGEDIPGVDLVDIREWTPESYVNKTIKGDE